MSLRFHRITFISIAVGLALAAACDSDNSNTDEDGGGAGGEGGEPASGGRTSSGGRPATGGDGGAGTGGAATVEPDVYGAWRQDCPAGEGGASSGACPGGEPWALVLGKTDVLGGPLTMVSSAGSLCGDIGSGEGEGEEYIAGTFGWDGSQLELFNCDSDPQNGGMAGAGARGRVFDVSFANGGKRMRLRSADDVEYVFDKQDLPESVVQDVRLISVGTISCTDGSIEYQSILSDEEGEAPSSWLSTVLPVGDSLIMDEFFDTVESGEGGGEESRSAGIEGWTFYEADDRGAQTATFPIPSNTRARGYRITHAPDLTPLFAVGYEVDDCSDDLEPRGFEYDFQRNVVFRRFWEALETTSESAIDLDVSGLSGTVKEIVVTVSVGALNAAQAEISLTSPDGTTVVLAAGENGDGTVSGFYYTSFSDRASKSITDDSLTTFEDQLRPENPLSAFAGENKNGTWILNVDSSEILNVDYFGLSIR